jgi:DNA-binding MarR family transcriptional regulator
MPSRPKPPATPEPEETATQVLRQFRQVFNAVKSHFQQVERKVGLGGAQVWALSVVRDQPGVGVGALAKAMAVHQSTASNLVRGLIERGLVVATKDGPDRRAVRLRLLPAGAKLLRTAPGPFAGLLPDALKSLDEPTLLRLQADLAKLITVLGADEGGGSVLLADL